MATMVLLQWDKIESLGGGGEASVFVFGVAADLFGTCHIDTKLFSGFYC